MIGISATPTSSGQPKHYASGFTLIEVLIVLAITAMIYGLFAPSFTKRAAQASFEASVQTVVDDLKTLRTEAIISGRPTRFTIAPDGSGYSAGDRTRALKAGIRLRRPSPDKDVILYYPTGNSDAFVLQVEGARRQATLSANWLTGAIDIENHALPELPEGFSLNE